MRQLRKMGLLYVSVGIFIFPMTVVHAHEVISNFLIATPYEDGFIAWLNVTFQVHSNTEANDWRKWFSGGFNTILISLLSIPMLIWQWRYIFGALEEVRLSKNVNAFGLLKCVLRWLIVAYTSSVMPLLLGLFLFYLLTSFKQVSPILSIVISMSLVFVLYGSSWYIPKLLLKQAQNKAEWINHNI
jgi:hypothetical protein